MGILDNYEGFVSPKAGPSPYKIIDDPEIIAKKNKMREALRNEYTKKHYNPYRIAAGVGGQPFDSSVIRYNAMMRTKFHFYRPGPRFMSATLFCVIIPYGLIVYFVEKDRRNRQYLIRTGQVAYADRDGKRVL